MEIINFTIKEFFGIIVIFPFLIYFVLVLFDGIGIFRDIFYVSDRTRTR